MTLLLLRIASLIGSTLIKSVAAAITTAQSYQVLGRRVTTTGMAGDRRVTSLDEMMRTSATSRDEDRRVRLTKVSAFALSGACCAAAIVLYLTIGPHKHRASGADGILKCQNLLGRTLRRRFRSACSPNGASLIFIPGSTLQR